MDIEDCIRKNLIRKSQIDSGLIKSLIEISNIKARTVKSIKIIESEQNVVAVLPLAYDSMRELCEALAISIGFKITSHVCLGILLKKHFNEFNITKFDRFRYIRNSINYYGEKVDTEQGKEIIKNILEFRKEILNKFLNKYI
jgi:uncharacterized protein (UPF0332 family)